MFESMLIKHCSPTLAGLKAAGLFNFRFQSEQEAQQILRLWNRRLNPKGIWIHILKFHDGRALIYVCRYSALEKLLSSGRECRFLANYGYKGLSCEEAIHLLGQRVMSCPEFPHEIGIFLDYPLDDVIGFIENSGRNCKCCGCWKVYCNECEAKKTFARYKTCHAMYERLFRSGISPTLLAVAA